LKYVLFVCTHNAGRSQMAQALFERHAPADIRAESAGQEPAAEVWPEVVAAMHEVGIDIAGRRPKKLTVEMQLHADWAITLACGASCPYVPTTVEDWDIPDPAGRPIEEVRAIRDAVELRVKELIEHRLDAIRSDRTAHQLRLARLLPDLAREFEGVRSEGEIRACADAILAEYQDAPVRSFVMTLAHKRTRECLAAEHCAPLATA
jgi:protein-tyrosine-phosphatase